MNTIATTIKNRPEVLLSFVVGVMICLVMGYVYLLSLTVVHVVMQKEISRDMTVLRSDISTLEAKYMTAQHRISNEIANRTDLATTNEKIFINRAADTLVLSTIDDG